MDPIAGIIDLADHVAPAFLVFTRISAIFVSAPVLSGGQIPFQAKALISLVLTIAMLPALGPELQSGVPGPLYPLAVFKEIITGIAIGYCLGLFLEAVRLAGDIIGRTAGLAAAEMFNPDAGTMEGPLGALFYISISFLFFLLDVHLAFIGTMAQSFYFIPLGGMSNGPHVGELVAVSLTHIYEIALTIALPIEGAILAITVAEGVIARAVPQINILHITFAIKIMTVMALLSVGIPAVVMVMAVVLNMAQDFTFAFIQAAGGA